MKTIFRKYREWYGDLKLQSKFTFALMLIVTVPALMVGVFFYSRLYDMVASYTISQEQDASAKTAPLIEDTVQEVLNASSEISALPFYGRLFHMPVNAPLSTFARSDNARAFNKSVQDIIARGPVTGVRIYMDFPNKNSELFQSPETGNIFAPLSQAKGTYWHGIFEGSDVTELYCPPFYLGTEEAKTYGDLAYIRSTSFYYHGSALKAYIAIYYSSENFNKILSDSLGLEGSVSYIMNERDNLVSSSDSSLSGIYWLNYATIKDSFMSSNNFIERTVAGNKIYAGFYSITQPQWFMVTVLPSDPLFAQSREIMFQFLFIYLGFLILAFFLASALARSITNRISSVIRQMQTVRKGPPVPMDTPTAHDEVGDLIDTYNYMTRKMNQLMANQAKAAEDLRIAEFNSLQAQINPHFLYNTMDMINWLAQQGRTSEISSAVQNLSRFYKLTLSQKKSLTTIASEEEHASIYVQLQNMRYHDSIRLISDIPDELMEYQIPKLTLQPVMENAVLHGILEKESRSGTIVLTGWMEDEDIILLLSDDGVGIPPEKMPTILSGIGQSSSGGTNIAICNTHRRLQILYGKQYGLSYSSEPSRGTEVQIRIPAQKEYQNPYIHSPETYMDRSVFPLVTVSAQSNAAMDSVSPETLLNYSQKLTQNLYIVHDLQRLSEKLPRNEKLYILSHEVTEDFPEHTHDYFELNYVCRGALLNLVDGNEVYMSAGDLVLLNVNAVHSLHYQQPDTLLINFCLKPELFEGTLKTFYEDANLLAAFFRGEHTEDKNYIFFSLGHSLHAQSILASIIQEYAANNFRQSFALEAFFLMLFYYLVSAEEFSYYGTDSRTHQMLQYLLEHCLEQKPDDIAEHFQYTQAQFDELIKKRTGRSCRSFTQEVRLAKALTLLADPHLNIYQIAEDCGYEDVKEFFKIFDEKFHISPTEYREQFL